MPKPVVIIRTNSTLDNFYEEIRYQADQKFHAFHATPANTAPLSEADRVANNTLAAYGEHLGNGLTIAGNGHVFDSAGHDLGHVERFGG